MKYCKKCLLPVDYLNIEIDDHGVCQHCNGYQQRDYLGVEQLKIDIQDALRKNTSKKYDCVVGFSGGRDSTYLLWFVVKVLNLRPLAVFSDDLFIPEVMLDNIRTTAEVLGVELRSIEHDNLKRCFPHHLKAWIKRPVAESLMFLNVGERIGYETLVEKEAVKEGVHLIFGGRTPIQSGAQYKTDLMKVGNRGGRLSWMMGYAKQVLLNPSLAKNLFCLKTQYREFMVTRWKAKLIKENDLTIIHPYYKYIKWVEKDIENVLFNELQWKLPEGAKNSGRFGCEADTLRQYLFYQILGYNDTNVDLSGLVRDGQVSRKDAAAKLESSVNIPEDYVKYIINKAGVDADAFMEKFHKRYPRRVFSADKME